MIKRNGIFLGLSLLFILVLGGALLMVAKGDLHLFLCDRHTPFGDIFFRYYTHIAEWFPYIVCIGLLLFGRLGDGVFASSAMLGTTLVTQIIKHIVVAPRPLTWFEQHFPDIQLPLAEGVKMNLWHSFPSGHTTSFFALSFVVCYVATQELKDKPVWSAALQVMLFCFAILGGYSRIYLSQHFAFDIFGGTLVGILVSLLCYAILHRYEDQKWYNYRVLAKK